MTLDMQQSSYSTPDAPMVIAQRHFEMVMEDIGQGVDILVVSQTFIPLFTNKLIGLKRVERNRTTHVNLVDYSWEKDNAWDSLLNRHY